MSQSYWIETLGCPKNEVDSEKLVGTLHEEGMVPANSVEIADLVVVNTCAFIEDAKKESIETIYALNEARTENSNLVVTGCMAERYGKDLQDAFDDDVDAVVGFGVPVTLKEKPEIPEFDLLNLPRPKTHNQWGYVKVAEGCDRICGFCSIPSFRGPQRSRTMASIKQEIQSMDLQEVVLVAQDLASYGRDMPDDVSIINLYKETSELVPWVRLLYLYPSSLTKGLVDLIADSPVPYFDLSLQHVSRPLLKRMRRWGDSQKFTETIQRIRRQNHESVFRTNFIVVYPGETEEDHDKLLQFVEENELDWCGFFAYSREEGTFADSLDNQVDINLVRERMQELNELQDAITANHRDNLVGTQVKVLVDSNGTARSFREAPEIDGVVHVPENLKVGTFSTVKVVEATGTDLVAINYLS